MKQLSDNAIRVLDFRYLTKLNGKVVETPEQLFLRVAKAIASVEVNAEMWEGVFFDMMSSLDFLPNTPCLINAGRELGELNACYVLGIEDNIEGIFDTIKHAALVHKGGGGTGFDFSTLRPEGSYVRKTQGISSGPISFMKVFNKATEEIKQGGVRRGANMGILRIDHPDIEAFINCKSQEGDLSNFNISVAVTDSFMTALKNEDKVFNLVWNDKVEKKVNPKKLWENLIENSWKNGEPGVIFIDVINKNNLLNKIETITATNPCGEQPLTTNGVCTLGSINLSNFIEPTKLEFDWTRFRVCIKNAVRFLDNVISVSKYPLGQIADEANRKRKIGLGIMGFADALIHLKINYDSVDAITFAEKIGDVLSSASIKESELLGKTKGIPTVLKDNGINRRNGLTTTIAPTGSLSLIANCSSGCEPVFSFEYKKECVSSSITVRHPLLEEYLNTNSSIKPLPPYFIESKDVSLDYHIKIQAAFQKYIHSGISKTINVKNKTTPAEISSVFKKCYDLGCKSVTVYRDGSRQYEALTDSKEEKKEIISKASVDRPRSLNGYTEKIRTSKGTLYITVNELSGYPFEVFLKLGKSGKDNFAYSEAIGRLISVSLRSGVDIEQIIKHLRNIAGDDIVWDEGQIVKSIPDAVAIVLRNKYMKEEDVISNITKLTCPECESENVDILESCITCKNCGWSKCQ